ncbi:SDR family NAD(P)-dependent oxidoreductase [Nonomuraea roseoviolacea]|uniref:NAD(P)-dependent dehydrogenase (Short-subunit alcohol dehydrogenase family) n=1 Tax=Nonomuraea roseoviolacea subsp. carminata TaxID=160689 RepID=A0ABT1KFP4_9ACTN|nr:SDR family NAD(P)-dependent oxidoreductase [Nonomuraea roseoviolacea]MCP2351769.1 NAD(P)-dependent dehydrogenase (short-subunit alcohol dehydrogenase family) [Nonomuraea roseoviolacea subsp. carminata]
MTGTGSGIGRAAAIEPARQGAIVAVTDIDEATAAETTEMLRKDGGEAQVLPALRSRSRSRGGGAIVDVASNDGLYAIPTAPAYVAAKKGSRPAPT